MKKSMLKSICLGLYFIGNLFATNLTAQVLEPGWQTTGPANQTGKDSMKPDPLTCVMDYIRGHREEWGLTLQDITDMEVRDMVEDRHTGIIRFYFRQKYQDIPVYQAILNVNLGPDGKVFHTGNRFMPDLAGRVNALMPSLAPREVITVVMDSLGWRGEAPVLKRQQDERTFLFDKEGIAREDIRVSLYYQPYKERARLAWEVLISPLDQPDSWSVRIDAITGEILGVNSRTLNCGYSMPVEDDGCGEVAIVSRPLPSSWEEGMKVSANTLPGYHLLPPTIDNLNLGPLVLVTDPSDGLASPYGWHDVNGAPGADYTITRGNNIHAFQDRDNLQQSSGDEPNGGQDLLFDFPFDPALEPEENIDAAVVNAFCTANFMHDFSYRFGFDEAAGNFQENNYGHGGKGNDAIILYAQAGANTGKKNNAQFQHEIDGLPSTISMYIFTAITKYLTVQSPAAIAGQYAISPPSAGWGQGSYVTTTPVTGELVWVQDEVENPTNADACEQIINAAALQGKIAVVERGGCEFGWKALQVQNAGAIGMICINYNDDSYTMNPATYGSHVHIPVILLGLTDSKRLRPYAHQGVIVSLVDPGAQGPSALDSDFDNGLIIHEYGHGISNRLIGGPNTECLYNAEQMGEGWSDFFTLAITTQPGQKGTDPRGFGTYGVQEPPTGKGLRLCPYSTDMNVAPLTYGDLAAAQEEHDLGQVWGCMLWDMYWALVDRYGWSQDFYDLTSGNNRAIRLVMEGMRNVACNPGFVDARDAILAADEVLYQGQDICILWQVFARRGLGFSADQGSPWNAGDQREAFDIPASCRDDMDIAKSMTPVIDPGEDIQVSIQVSNYKNETATEVVVTDQIPDGATYKINSSNFPVSVQGNELRFTVGTLPVDADTTVRYTLQSSPERPSISFFEDSVTEETRHLWNVYSLGDITAHTWALSGVPGAHSGDLSWNATEFSDRSRQILELNPDAYLFHVSGFRPALRFYHRYQNQDGNSGGIVEVKEAGQLSWRSTSGLFLRHGYTTGINYLTFLAPDMRGFSGTNGIPFEDSYVDLRPWSGKDIQIRFRFGTNEDSGEGFGWLIDDIAFLDLVSYNGEACVTTGQGDMECTIAPDDGTIVSAQPAPTSSVTADHAAGLMVYPNPAVEQIQIHLDRVMDHPLLYTLYAVDGQVMKQGQLSVPESGEYRLAIHDVLPGFYLLQIMTGKDFYTGKVVIQR